MDEHRKEYYEVRDFYIEWLNQLDIKLAKVDPDYSPTTGKQAINRINNNLLFHPNKPVYKDHFGAGLDKEKGKGDFYIHIGINESFVAGGLYKPKKEMLDSIRAAIDYNGEKFKKILNKKSFKNTFGELMEDEKLKTSPKAYSKDHEHIDLLRNKSFAVMHSLTHKEIVNDDFQEQLIEIYKEMLPFRNYLNNAVTV
ncbi:TIGR02453 family protein [Christiangramia forsetii]|nr:TIGR02453 family protein [Christiangramia forsetii]